MSQDASVPCPCPVDLWRPLTGSLTLLLIHTTEGGSVDSSVPATNGSRGQNTRASPQAPSSDVAGSPTPAQAGLSPSYPGLPLLHSLTPLPPLSSLPPLPTGPREPLSLPVHVPRGPHPADTSPAPGSINSRRPGGRLPRKLC